MIKLDMENRLVFQIKIVSSHDNDEYNQTRQTVTDVK